MLAILFAASLVGETLTGPAIALGGPSLQMSGPDGATWHVLLYGIKTPDMGAPLGPQARGLLDDMIKGREIECRVLAMGGRQGTAWVTCEADGRDLSEAVLREGLATAYRAFTYAGGADPELAARLDAAEATARAEGLGIWATTAVAPDKSLWEAIRDDPRSIVALFGSLATMITAFAGFYLGTRYNHKLTMERDEARRAFETEQAKEEKERARRALASELHAELRYLMRSSQSDKSTIEKFSADMANDEKVRILAAKWQGVSPPTLAVLEAHIGQLGLLPHELASRLIHLNGLVEWHREASRAVAEIDGRQITLSGKELRVYVKSYETIMRDLIKLNGPLAEVAGVEPHDWGEIEAKLGPKPTRGNDGAADASAESEEVGEAEA